AKHDAHLVEVGFRGRGSHGVHETSYNQETEPTSMKLHQVKIDFEAEQDRLLMLIAASEKVEVRMWLTRRFVKLLWPLLVKLAEEASPRIRTQANPEAKKALLGIEHEQAVSKANFSLPYDDSARATPLGAEPLLLARIQTGHDPNGHPVVAMHPAE